MAVIVNLVTFAIDPKRHDAFVAQMTLEAESLRGFDGCLGLTVAQAPGSEIMVLERWASADHAQRSIQWRREDGRLAVLAQYFVKPPVIHMFQEMTI